jgi:hypothetical protein
MAFDVVSAIGMIQAAGSIIQSIQAQARLAREGNEISDADLAGVEHAFDTQSALWDAEVAAAKARIAARAEP